MRRSFAILFVIAIAVVMWLTFPRPSDPSPFKKATDQHLHLTLPPDGTATEPRINRTDWEITAEWRIETNMKWEEYKIWAAKQLGSSYDTAIMESEFQITFRRTDHSETHLLRFGVDEAARQIHVRFSTSPW